MSGSPIPQSAPAPSRIGPSPRFLRLASDERLVALVRTGSQSAFEVLYDRHHRALLSFCRHMLASREEAEDAVQQTFMAAHRALMESAQDIKLRAWLYAIARNRCLSVLRMRREQPLEAADEPATEGLAAEVQRRQELRDLLGDLSELPDDQRAALVLAELGDLSHDEIATVLGCPKDKVKALVFQARTSLHTSRQARETSCDEIREQLANLSGAALRRGTLRRHVRECAGCREFQAEVSHQRRAMGVLLPVVPTLGLKGSVLTHVFGGGGATAAGVAAAGGAGAAAGGVGAAAGGALAAKGLVVLVLAGGGVVAVESVDRGDRAASESRPVPAKVGSRPPAPAIAAPATTSVETDASKTTGVRRRPHGNRRGKTDRGKAFAKTRGKGKHLGIVKAKPRPEKPAKARPVVKAKPKPPPPRAKPPKPAPTPRPAKPKPPRPATPTPPAVRGNGSANVDAP